MLPKLNFLRKNQEEFEEGQLVSSSHPFDHLPDKALSDSKPQLPFGFNNQRKNRSKIKSTSTDRREAQQNGKIFPPKPKLYSPSHEKTHHLTQNDAREREIRINKNHQPPKPYPHDPYRLYYGQQKNQFPYPPRHPPYKHPNFTPLHQNQPHFLKEDVYPPFYHYPFPYEMGQHPPPYYPPPQIQQNRVQVRYKQEQKQATEIVEQGEKVGEKDEGQREKRVEEIDEKVGQILDRFDDEDRQIVIEIFQDILQDRKGGCESLWNFIDRHKGGQKERKGELIFELLDVLQMDSVMFLLRDIEQQQKQCRLQKASQIKKLLYSLVAPIHLT